MFRSAVLPLALLLGLLAPALVAQGTPKRPSLGVLIEDADGGNGVVVVEVRKGRPAAEAGIKAGDRIVRFGEKRVRRDADLVSALNATKAGSKVKVGLVRNREDLELTVAFGSAPKSIAATPLLPMVPREGAKKVEEKGLDPMLVSRRALKRAVTALENEPDMEAMERVMSDLDRAKEALAKAMAKKKEEMEAKAKADAGPPDFEKLSQRIGELMGQGLDPKEVEKKINSEFPGMNIRIMVGDPEEMDDFGEVEEMEEVPAPASRPASRPKKKKGDKAPTTRGSK